MDERQSITDKRLFIELLICRHKSSRTCLPTLCIANRRIFLLDEGHDKHQYDKIWDSRWIINSKQHDSVCTSITNLQWNDTILDFINLWVKCIYWADFTCSHLSEIPEYINICWLFYSLSDNNNKFARKPIKSMLSHVLNWKQLS